MKFLFLALLCLTFTLTAAAQNALSLPSEETLEAWLSENKVPGMAIGIFEDGKLQTIGAGINHQGDSITPQTVFDVASITKTVTTLLTLKLVEQGRWELDAPLYPYWTDPEVAADERHRLLTTRHILSHQSGFPNWRWMNDDKKLSFSFVPGSRFGYSGEGFEYLRRALESKFNRSFEQLADSLVFKPLLMKNSSLVWEKQFSQEQFAGTHKEDGKPYAYEAELTANAADNLLTTVHDFGLLCQALLEGTLLSVQQFQNMGKPHAQVREGISFGLGWIVFQDLPGGEYALFNAGSDTGVNALVVLLPETQRALLVFTNGDNGRMLAMKTIAYLLGDTGAAILGRF